MKLIDRIFNDDRMKVGDPECTCGKCTMSTWVPKFVIRTVYRVGVVISTISYVVLIIPALAWRGLYSGWINANNFISQSVRFRRLINMTPDQLAAERAQYKENIDNNPMAAMLRQRGGTAPGECQTSKGQVH